MSWIAMSCAVAALVTFSELHAEAATDTEQCAALKNTIASKYQECRAKAEAKALLAASPPDHARCAATFTQKWSAAETKYGVACPDNTSVAAMEQFIGTQTDLVAELIAGTATVPICGDDAINAPGEECDGTALGGASCTTLGYRGGGTLTCASCTFDVSGCIRQGFPASGATTSHVSGDDGALRAGLPLSYTDNRDGTITDNVTGLMWEKKIGMDDLPFYCLAQYYCAGAGVDAGLHDVNNQYPWRGGCMVGGADCGTDADCGPNGPCRAIAQESTNPNGWTIFQWVEAVNAERFAGYDDWRVPNLKELLSITDYGRGTIVFGPNEHIEYGSPVFEELVPAVDPAFHGARCGLTCLDLADPDCSCDPFGGWSSTPQRHPDFAWVVSFGITAGQTKDTSGNVRAVRGGMTTTTLPPGVNNPALPFAGAWNFYGTLSQNTCPDPAEGTQTVRLTVAVIPSSPGTVVGHLAGVPGTTFSGGVTTSGDLTLEVPLVSQTGCTYDTVLLLDGPISVGTTVTGGSIGFDVSCPVYVSPCRLVYPGTWRR